MNLHTLNVRSFLEDAVAGNASSPYLIWEDTEQSYEDFNARVDEAAALWHNMGIRKGDRVAFMADNSPGFLHAWLGLAKIGAVLVAVNTGFKYEEAKYLIDHSEARFALIDPAHGELFRRISDGSPHLGQTLALGAADGYEDFADEARRAGGRAPSVQLEGDDLISLIYTSGTTGRPKGVMQTHRNYVLTGQAYPAWMKMERGDRIYACLPLFHINSQAYSTMGAIGAEGAMVLAPRFSASRFWPEVRRHRVNVFNYIGAMTVILSKSEVTPEDRDHDVRVAYGVPALPHDVRMGVEERFGVACVSGFGMSETTYGLLEPIDGERVPDSMGVPRSHPDPSVPRTEAMIIGEDGAELPRGEVGELVLRGPATMLGYFKDPEKTAEALVDGWLRTGDSAWQDAEGRFFFVDRKKDIVRRRGENVSSLEVEMTINTHPDVRESAVIGVPSDMTDEELCVFVVAQPGREIDPESIIAWADDRLAAFKIPRYVETIEALPKTPTSKIEKHRLRSGDYSAGPRYDGGVRSTRRTPA
ncbi:AMP-binding protein [Homoserinibacter sp. YIM 151385]|uniref:AMP-binding protein n=1 Tax=Homoserinibacter sp. YIM 151385 TaxID=2985506 RepID=UPI0022F0945B|nr:AMP-binding protein [Homoserinibacter sp. YIM 151385]WBU37103.1 AMP-binding protein [Homoserinibacter sp. YIM 151385]